MSWQRNEPQGISNHDIDLVKQRQLGPRMLRVNDGEVTIVIVIDIMKYWYCLSISSFCCLGCAGILQHRPCLMKYSIV